MGDGDGRTVHIFYGSATGNSEFIAKRIHADCQAKGWASQVMALNDWKKMSGPAFEEIEVGVFVCATTGNGDAPENAERFWRFLKRRTQPKDMLAKLHYTVLGLGDTNYDKFCHMGKGLDSRLGDVGATRFYKLGTADEAVGLEGTVEPWVEGLYPALAKLLGAAVDAVEANANGTAAAAAAAAAAAPLAPEPAATTTAVTAAAPAPAPGPAETVVAALSVSGGAGAQGGAAAPAPAAASAAPATSTTTGPITREGPLCRESGARWVMDLLTAEERAALQAELSSSSSTASASASASTYQPSVRITLTTASPSCSAATDPTTATATAPLAAPIPLVSPVPPPPGVPPRPRTSPSPFAPSALAIQPPAGLNSRAASVSPLGASVGGTGRASPGGGGWRSPVAAAAPPLPYCYEKPAMVTVKQAKYLTTQQGDGHHGADSDPAHTRRVLQLELDLSSCFPAFSYVPGDAVGVRCPNREAAVAVVLARLGMEAGSTGTAAGAEQRKKRIAVVGGTALGGLLEQGSSVEGAVREVMDLDSPPKPHLLKALASFTSDPDDRALLSLLGSAANGGKNATAAAVAWERWVAQQRLSLAELLEQVPSCKPSLEALLDLLPPLPARYYSVASSPLLDPNTLSVAFSIVDYALPLPTTTTTTTTGTVRRKGLCTMWLESVVAAPFLKQPEGEGGGSNGNKPVSVSSAVSVPIFLKPAKEFVLPGSAKWPLVLVGPGTGVAPFIGFLQHRQARRQQIKSTRTEVCTGYWRGGFEVSEEGEEDENSLEAYSSKEGEGPIWLFFGCRRRDTDWIYRPEMETFLGQGVLTELHTAFSREDPQAKEKKKDKVYVQHRMLEQGDRLARLLLQEGAYLYVCGDADNMARDVHQALRQLLAAHGQGSMRGSEEEAEAFLQELKQRQRYVLDIWT